MNLVAQFSRQRAHRHEQQPSKCRRQNLIINLIKIRRLETQQQKNSVTFQPLRKKKLEYFKTKKTPQAKLISKDLEIFQMKRTLGVKLVWTNSGSRFTVKSTHKKKVMRQPLPAFPAFQWKQYKHFQHGNRILLQNLYSKIPLLNLGRTLHQRNTHHRSLPSQRSQQSIAPIQQHKLQYQQVRH
jgi:hypothetical protein